MTNDLIYCLTKFGNVLIWQNNLYSIACTCEAIYTAINTKQLMLLLFLPPRKTKPWTTSSHLHPHPFWVTSRKSQAMSYVSYLAFFSTTVLALGSCRKHYFGKLFFISLAYLMSFNAMTLVAGSNENHSRQICPNVWNSEPNLAAK